VDSAERDRIVESLSKAKALLPCPRCGNESFSLVDGFVAQPIQPDFRNVQLGGPTLPSVATVCSRCGFISCHALGVLGLLPPREESKQ
jgi:ribosomal protein L37E